MKNKKDLAVVYIITKLELGGAQKVCLALFEGLQKEGIPCYLISGMQGPLVDMVKNNPNALLLNEFTREVTLSGFAQEIRGFFKLIRTLKKLKYQHPHLIVHTHSTKAGIVGRFAAWCAGISYRIHTVHGYGFHQHQSWIAWLITYICELVSSFITTHFICVSSADVKTGINLFHRFDKRHSVIRAAVAWQQFYIPTRKVEWFDEKKTFIFGTVSCFKPQKNLLDLLRAFKYVHEKFPLSKLEIVGDGFMRKELETWIHEHNLSHAIILHGWQHDVAFIMKSWHVFVMSSLWEGLPCSVVEARLMKLPVVCYDTGGIHDVIIHGENGLLCDQKNWMSLAENMLTVARQPVLYTHLQQHCDDLNDFQMSSMIHEHINLYQSLK